MSKIVVTKQQRELAPEGLHIARCVQIIHIGTVFGTGKYADQQQNKVLLAFELPNEQRVFTEEKGSQPFMVSKEFTLFLSDKSNLLKFIQSWRGKQFTPTELEAFDVSKLLGVPCMINIMHVTAKTSGNKYVDITSITSLMKGTVAPPAISPLVSFGYDPYSEEVYEGLPEWLRNKISTSVEYKAIHEAPKENISKGNLIEDKPLEEPQSLPF